jgi:hypothetical protein
MNGVAVMPCAAIDAQITRLLTTHTSSCPVRRSASIAYSTAETPMGPVDTPGSQIGTAANSANDRFWTRLVEIGLAEERTLDLDVPPELRTFLPKSFALTVPGRAIVAELLTLV